MTSTILVIAHGHQDFATGGAEVAAYQLFQALQQLHPEKKTVLLARHGSRDNSGMIALLRKDEYLWRTSISDWFKLQSSQAWSITGPFRRFLAELKPDIVFVHHYAHIGLEMLREIRHTCPTARIVLTLHEYMGICHQTGQMVKRPTGELCFSESPQACVACFPERTEEDFWLRKHFIKRHFDAVDRFVSPSAFLKKRYVDWGLPESKIAVIENGQPRSEPLAPRPLPEGGTRNRFGFFGQVNPFKGVDVLLQALAGLPKKERRSLHVEIHGGNIEVQTEAFQEKIAALREPLMEERVLHWPGPYNREDLARRMSKLDWVVVPSIWWENSPVVIQEALRFGRPILCSNIGGMAEHVRDGLDGRHVGVGNVTDWGETMLAAAADVKGWDRLYLSMKRPLDFVDVARQYLDWALKADSPAEAPPRLVGGRLR